MVIHMSKKKTSISRRVALLSDKSNEYGFCVICSKEGKLTKDHVPPTNATLTVVDSQKTALEFFNKDGVVKPQRITTGSYSRTICIDCNNKVLGSLDNEIGNVHKQLASLIEQADVCIDEMKYQDARQLGWSSSCHR